jgi:hypothetical protein
MTGIIMNIDIKNKNRRVTDLIGPRALCSASLRNRTGGSSDFLSSFNVTVQRLLILLKFTYACSALTKNWK